MLNHILPPDTQAILLLCGSFGQSRQTYPQPLTLSEYNLIAGWLREEKMTPKDLLEPMGKSRLEKIILSKIDVNRLISLLERGVTLGFSVEKWANQGIWVLGRSDSRYPKRLKEKLQELAPPLIYGIGNIDLLGQGGLAVVGSRHVDAEITDYTKKVVETCAEQGIQIISGGAGGIDRTAMLGVLDTGGTSVGVLADSLIKESLSKNYRQSIQENQLTLISVYDPDAGFSVGSAMGRNKYIYGLADYTLVVNTTMGEGGTWAGAVEALEKIKNVPVFVRIEGKITEANQQLIHKGAWPFPLSPWHDSLRELLTKVMLKSSDPEKAEIEPLSLIEQDETALLKIANVTPVINQPEDGNEKAEIEPLLLIEQDETALLKIANVTPVINQPEDGAVKTTPVSDYTNKDVYEVVLPLILHHLLEPKNAKSLAESLNVRLPQMNDWLKRAVDDGIIRKNKKPVTYEVNSQYKNVSLHPSQSGDN